MLNTSQQPNNDQFADAYREAEALGYEVKGAEDTRKALAAENATRTKISNMTREQILEQLKKPGMTITAENYYEAMKLHNELLALNEDERRAKLQTIGMDKKTLLLQALRFHELVKNLDEETRESLATEEIRLQNLERDLFADLEGVVEEIGSKPIEISEEKAA